MFLERAEIGVSLMIAFIVRAFKKVGAWFSLFCFKV